MLLLLGETIAENDEESIKTINIYVIYTLLSSFYDFSGSKVMLKYTKNMKNLIKD